MHAPIQLAELCAHLKGSPDQALSHTPRIEPAKLNIGYACNQRSAFVRYVLRHVINQQPDLHTPLRSLQNPA